MPYIWHKRYELFNKNMPHNSQKLLNSWTPELLNQICRIAVIKTLISSIKCRITDHNCHKNTELLNQIIIAA